MGYTEWRAKLVKTKWVYVGDLGKNARDIRCLYGPSYQGL